MAYTKKTWVNVPDPSKYTNDELNSFPRYDAENMNRIEDGVEIGASTIVLDGEDILSVTVNGQYYTRNCINTPVQANGYMRVICYNDLYRTVEWTRNGVRSKYLNILKEGNWLGWTEIVHTGNAPTLVLDAITQLPIHKGGTGGKTELEALNNLKAISLGEGTPIKSGDDLDSYVSVGNYMCKLDSIAIELSNCPVKYAFRMTVGYANGEKRYLYQEITCYNTGVKYYRMCDSSTYNWNKWEITYTTSNKPTPEEIGATKVITGTYTGDLNASKFIDLGVTPKAVLVILNGSELELTNAYTGGLAITERAAVWTNMDGEQPIVKIVTNGFQVFNDNAWSGSNSSTHTYNYVAWT